jgi:uncharacterized protein YjbI with pentapeptide repeats
MAVTCPLIYRNSSDLCLYLNIHFLTEAVLTEAVLTEAVLTEAVLTEAVLTETVYAHQLCESIVTGANRQVRHFFVLNMIAFEVWKSI